MNREVEMATQTDREKPRTELPRGGLPAVARRQFTRLVAGCVAFVCMAALVACAPTPPRFGNFGGPMAEQPASQAVIKQALSPAPETDWFPVQARFHPDGKRLVLNFCRGDAPYYCRMVLYDIVRKDWSLLPNQQEGVSYFRPSFSNNGKTLVFSQSPCSPDRKQCNDGYGQLTTMPADGGSISLLPVRYARRAHFTADDRRLTYWRIKTTGKLASGRPIGSVSVYEYDLASGEEVPLIESMEAAPEGVRFIADLTAPRYTVDGKTLFFCALNDETYKRDPVTNRPVAHPVPGSAANCFMYERERQAYKLIDTDRMRLTKNNIGHPYLQDKQRGFLTGSALGFVDATSLEVQPRFFSTGRIQRADADLNPQGNTAVAVTGTVMFKNGAHTPNWYFYSMKKEYPKLNRQPTQADAYYVREAPVLALINVDTHEVSPIEWPDISRLPVAHKP